MERGVLPGEGDDLLGEVEGLGDPLFAVVGEEVVEVLPAEDHLDQSPVLEGAHDLAEVDVDDVGALVGFVGEVLVQADHALLEEVAVDGLLL